MPSETITRELHFGENLEVLRRSIADRSVHLVYLDPPFNSNRAFHLWSAAPRSTAPRGKQNGAHGAVLRTSGTGESKRKRILTICAGSNRRWRERLPPFAPF